MPSVIPFKSISTERNRLMRVLGLGFGLAVTVGNTIGAGILRTPGDIAGYLPNPWLFLGIWIVGGLFPLIAAPSFAELGSMIPRSGGHYVFTREALGEYPGFVIGWTDWISNCGSTSAVAIVIGEYSAMLFRQLNGHATAIALTVVIVLAGVQWMGIKVGSRFQQISTLLKALAFLSVVIACFLFKTPSLGTPTAAILPSGAALFTAVVLSLQAAIYTYDGWAGVIYFSEETPNPNRDIPGSIFGGLASIIIIYVLLNAAILYILPVSQIAGEKLALGTAANLIWGERGNTVIQVIVIVSMLSAINAYLLMMCRIPFAMSRDRLFPHSAAHVNSGGTPDLALLISTLVALAFIVTGTFSQVIAVLAFFFVLNYILGLVSTFVLRKRDPDRPRAYRAWGYPWTTGIALFVYVAFIVGAIIGDQHNSIYSLLLLVGSYPVFKIFEWIKTNGENPVR
jgi:APA family basic amino acid/polyamine antiporter